MNHVHHPTSTPPLHLTITGQGRPLLLIAGMLSDGTSWDPAIPLLEQNHRVIRPDNRGTGRSPDSWDGITITDMADDCAAVLRRLGITGAVVLGHSMGGFIALDLAARHPELCSRLVLAGTGTHSPPEVDRLFGAWSDGYAKGGDRAAWFSTLFDWIFAPQVLADPELRRAAVQASMDHPWPVQPAALRRQVEAIAAFDATPLLPAITAPTLVVAGTADRLFPPDAGCVLAAGIRDARLLVVEGAGHAMVVECAGELPRWIAGPA